MTWETVPLGELLELKYGKALKAEDRVTGEFPVVGSGGIVGTHTAAITTGPTIVVGRKGSIGSLTYLENGCWPIDTAYFIAPKREVNLRWLYWMMGSLRLSSMNKSAAVPGLNRDDAYRARIPLPPVPEQRRIAAILDAADALRSVQTASLDRIRMAHQRFLERGFRNRTTRTLTLGDLLTRIDSGHSPVCEGRPAEQGEWGVLKLGAVTTGRYCADENKAIAAGYAPLDAHEVKRGDILLSRKNTIEHVGASVFVAETPQRRLLPDLIFRLIPWDEGVSGALQAFLALPATRLALSNMAGGSAQSMANISKERLRTLLVPEFDADLVTTINDANSAAFDATRASETALELHNELFASLQHRAFRGEL